MRSTFVFTVSAITPLGKNGEAHNLKLAMCIVFGDVVESACSQVVSKTRDYCNHSWLLCSKSVNFCCLKVKVHKIWSMMWTKIL